MRGDLDIRQRFQITRQIGTLHKHGSQKAGLTVVRTPYLMIQRLHPPPTTPWMSEPPKSIKQLVPVISHSSAIVHILSIARSSGSRLEDRALVSEMIFWTRRGEAARRGRPLATLVVKVGNLDL